MAHKKKRRMAGFDRYSEFKEAHGRAWNACERLKDEKAEDVCKGIINFVVDGQTSMFNKFSKMK
jgi:hypothetical protein